MAVNKLNCPKCENSFFTAVMKPNLPCPHCGFMLKGGESERRIGARSPSLKLCDILKGEVRIPAKAVDVSDTGIGIKMMGYLPFDQDDIVNVFLRELGEERPAQVVWTRKFYGISRAGLRFIDELPAIA